MRKPDLRRPVAGPDRQSRWTAALEVAFGWVAKGTMVLAGLAVVALMVLTGDASGVSDLPGTRKGWLYLLLVSIVVLALLFAFLYYWPAPAKVSTAVSTAGG